MIDILITEDNIDFFIDELGMEDIKIGEAYSFMDDTLPDDIIEGAIEYDNALMAAHIAAAKAL